MSVDQFAGGYAKCVFQSQGIIGRQHDGDILAAPGKAGDAGGTIELKNMVGVHPEGFRGPGDGRLFSHDSDILSLLGLICMGPAAVMGFSRVVAN